VTEAARENPEVPAWARGDAFPKSPPGWGWLDHKRRPHPCDSHESLIDAIRDDRDSRLLLAWTPEHANMILPEEVSGTAGAVLASRKRIAADDLLDAQDKLRWYGLLLGGLAAYMLYRGWFAAPGIASPAERFGFALRGILNSISMGITLLMFLIFAFIPWYQARKRMREFGTWTADDVAAVVPVLRFETWLQSQKAPVTRFLLVLMGAVGLAQLLPGESIQAAGLVKPAYLQGEWWRLLTAPMLHGHPLHFLMNAAALVYLGKRIEVLARWPHVPLVFLFSACIGGEASARFVAMPTVGASGGLMGWLGFLLVFESLHAVLVPRSARRRLVAGVLLTGLIGLIGYRFIDNAAHAGGLLAGMLYALIVFPKSASAIRPSSTITDRIAGIAALAVLVLAAVFAVFRMVILGMR
jgi:membrane associated rhomboid family serine protease